MAHLHAKKAKLTPKFKFGEKVPRTLQEACEIDAAHSTTGWKDAIGNKTKTLKDECHCFEILEQGQSPPVGCQFIKLLWTFDIKFDGRTHARLVAGGHMTETLSHEEVASSMVTLDTVKLLILRSILMGNQVLMGDMTMPASKPKLKNWSAPLQAQNLDPCKDKCS